VASLLPLRGRNLRRTPLPIWGMVISHFGLAVALLGMASEAAFSIEKLAALNPGESRQVGPYALSLDRIDPVAGPNWTALQATVSARYAGGAGRAQPAGAHVCQSAGHAHRIGAAHALERPALCRAG
jgi:cytochrome c-type biogenesis protein CcmF